MPWSPTWPATRSTPTAIAWAAKTPQDALNLNFVIGYDGVNLAVDGSFEAAGASSGPPNAFGIWSGDRSAGSGPTTAWCPVDGAKMFRFLNTGSSAKAGVTWGDVWQLIDLSPFADDVATGQAVIWASSQFNRDEGLRYWRHAVCRVAGGLRRQSQHVPGAVGHRRTRDGRELPVHRQRGRDLAGAQCGTRRCRRQPISWP